MGIIDVGSNTVRLLIVHRRRCGALEPVREARASLGLGAEIERSGSIPADKLEETARRARRYARLARDEGCETVDVVVTAPGRQSVNAAALVEALERAAGAPVRVLSAQEEGRFAYLGALVGAGEVEGPVAVCDVGGGSTELAVGLAGQPPVWLGSYDVGSLRLTHRCLAGDPPRGRQVRHARADVSDMLAAVEPPAVRAAFASGGTARSVRKLVGRQLGARELEQAIEICSRTRASRLASRYGIDPQRAATLTAGAVILAEVQERLGIPFTVARGGLREGLAQSLLVPQTAAA